MKNSKYNIVRYFNDLKCSDADCKLICPFYEGCNAMNAEAGLCDYITLHWNN